MATRTKKKTSPAVEAARAAAAEKGPQTLVYLIEWRVDPAQAYALEETLDALNAYGASSIIDCSIVDGSL